MRYSELFPKTLRSIPKEAGSVNHQLLVKGGFIDQVAAGIYNWLPLGLRVLRKVENIIREEMNILGCQEVFLPTLQPKNLWQQTGRWDDFDVLFKTKSKSGKEYALGPTHEEIVTPLAAKFIQSYKDLPLYLYQIQNKYRDELRAKSGLLRGREFGMKDLYTFHSSKEDFLDFYEKSKEAYLKIFKRCGLETKITEASGGSFTKKFSHEFNVLTPAGEVDIVYCPKCTFCQNIEVSELNEGNECPSCQANLKTSRGIEVGNIFDLGAKFSEDFNLFFTDQSGHKQPVIMGCYGIGTTRLVGAIVEVYNDNKGIIWPREVTPYLINLIILDKSDRNVVETAKKIYQDLLKDKIEVLFDDRDESAGVKLADADLIGCYHQVICSKASLEQGGVEICQRSKKHAPQIIPASSLKDFLQIN